MYLESVVQSGINIFIRVDQNIGQFVYVIIYPVLDRPSRKFGADVKFYPLLCIRLQNNTLCKSVTEVIYYAFDGLIMGVLWVCDEFHSFVDR